MKQAASIENASSTDLLEAATAIVAGGDFDGVVRAALAQAIRLTGARYAACGVVDPQTGRFGHYITHGLDEAGVRAIGEPPHGHGLFGVLLSQSGAVGVRDIRTHPESYGFPVNHPLMSSFLGIGLDIDGVAWGTLCVTDKLDGTAFTERDRSTLTDLAQILTRVADPHLRAENVALEVADLAQERDAYAASNAIARSLAGQPDLDHMTELIVKRGRALTGVTSAVLALAGIDGYVVEAVAGRIDRSLLGSVVPLADDEVRLLLTGRSTPAERAGALAPLADHVGGAGVMVVPLVIRNQLIGVLACIDRVDGQSGFSPHDMAIADAFGTSAAVAIATARSAQEQALQRAIAASERERAHWARELHDETLQEMAAIKLLLGMAQRATSEDSRTDLLRQATRQIDAAAVDLRRLVAELRPAALDAAGLPAALQGLVARVRDLGGQTVRLDCSLSGEADASDGRLDPEVEGVVYRVVQEALTNVARHSGAGEAIVQVRIAERQLRVVVADDGVGFDPGAQRGGFGLIGMRERAELIGGDLRVESRPNGGTTVTLVAHIDSEVRNA